MTTAMKKNYWYSVTIKSLGQTACAFGTTWKMPVGSTDKRPQLFFFWMVISPSGSRKMVWVSASSMSF